MISPGGGPSPAPGQPERPPAGACRASGRYAEPLVGVVLVTGSAGLIGSEAVRLFAERRHAVVGIDNDMRRRFFGDEASTAWNRRRLEEEVPGYRHVDADVRDARAVDALFAEYGADLLAVIHTAAQP